MTEKNLVSIVVPLYNYAHYIEDLIKSVQSQNYKKWELIIIDDASTDNPEPIIRKYNDSNIQYFKLEENKGYATAKNEGIIRSCGEYIVVLDADDMLTLNSLKCRLDFLKKHKKIKWVHAKAYEFSNNIKNAKWRKRKFIRRFEKMRKTKNYARVWDSIHAQTVMVKRECYLKVGLYEETMRSMSDKEMWARLQFNIGIPGYVNKFVAYYRMHKKQMHRSHEKKIKTRALVRQLKNYIKKRKKGNLSGIRILDT